MLTVRKGSTTTVCASRKKKKNRVPRFSDGLQERVVEIAKLLADSRRLAIVVHLGHEGELPVKHLCERVGIQQPAVSHHIALMRDAGLVECRRDGRHNYYSLSPDTFHELVDALFELMGHADAKSFRFGHVRVNRTND